MPQEPSPPVIWIGPSRGATHAAVLQALSKWGMPTHVCPSMADLTKVLVVRDHPVVVACNERKKRCALDVVAILDRLASRVPLVVLAEEPDFGEYYYLTNHGAIGYFQIEEDPERIARGIARAAVAS